MNKELTIGVDLGGTHVSAVVWQEPEALWQQTIATRFSDKLARENPEHASQFVIESVASLIEQACTQYPDCRSVGIGVAGFVDADSGRLISSPNLPGLLDLDLGAALKARTGLDVTVENDAIAAAWAEASVDATAVRDLIYIGLGTGIGGGVVLNGIPWRGGHGLAMEIGHLIVEAGGRHCGCGRRGCLERYASASGVMLSYTRLGGEAVDAEQVAQRAGEGDQSAIDSFAKAGRSLGVAVSHIIKVLDISEIVIGGGMSAAWGWLKPHFDTVVADQLPEVFLDRLHVRMSSYGGQAGMVGAAKLAAEAARKITT